MTVVEFRKRRRRSVERKGMRMHRTVESDLGFGNGSVGRTPDTRDGRSSTLEAEMAARAEALLRGHERPAGTCFAYGYPIVKPHAHTSRPGLCLALPKAVSP